MNKIKLDEIDRRILNILQENARITNVQLATKVGISPPAMLERVKRLENNSIIKKYVALLNPEEIGKDTFAMVSVSLAVHQLPSIDSFTKQIRKLDEVLECYHVTGEDDFMLKVVVKNIQDYEKFILEKLTKIRGVSKMNTSFILSTVKYKTKINID
jgi:Lrp/AsnC family leucine-responsive transcriptional regulator